MKSELKNAWYLNLYFFFSTLGRILPLPLPECGIYSNLASK